MGHTQAAAGVAGVIKMVEAMRHGILPETIHLNEPSREVDWTSGAVELLSEAREWPAEGRPRRAGVSSFGLTGTNAHVIIEQVPEVDAESGSGEVPSVVPLVLSAKSEVALVAQAGRLADLLEGGSAPALVDVGYSLACARSVFEYRSVVVAGDRVGAVEALRGELASVTRVRGAGKSAWVFSGQGAQRLGMGRELHAAFPVFAAAFDEVCAGFEGVLDGSLREVVWGEDKALLDQTVWAQAGLFAVEVALFRLLESWGVRPDYLVGHSIGEVAAAHVAGMVSLADACVLVGARGRLMQALPSGGAMLAVQAPVGEVVSVLPGGVEVAAVNSPVSVVVSGVEGAVAEVVGVCAGRGWKSRRLAVSHAFHSALMEPMLEEFARALDGMRFGLPRIPVVSTVTGEPLTAVDARYWVDQVRRPVRFADAVAHVADAGVRTFLEVGPDAALTPMVEHTVDDGSVAPASRRDRDEVTTLITALARLHANGVPIAWEKFFAGTGARRIDLPTYAFQHRSYWLKPQVADDVSRIGQRAVEHPLLRAAIARPDSDGAILTGRLSVEGQPWLADHTVLGRVLLPGTAFVE
ncbi:acyltransferase domain-containing protein, partial [Streptomyces tendae]